LFTDQPVAFPQGCAPGGDFAEFFVVLAGDRQRSPMTEPAAGFDHGFQNGFAGQIAFGSPAQFQSQQRGRELRTFEFPLDIETNAGNFVGVLTEISLIRIAVVKTGRQRVFAVQIEQMRKNFDDPAFNRIGRKRGREKK